MYKKIIQTAVFTCALVLSPVVLADHGGCAERLKHMVESLKLNENQKVKVKPILKQLKLTLKNDEKQMKGLDNKLEYETESAKMDQSKVDDLVNKKTMLIGDMMKAKIKAKNEIYAVLNPQEKKELQHKMKEMKAKWHQKFKKCHEE